MNEAGGPPVWAPPTTGAPTPPPPPPPTPASPRRRRRWLVVTAVAASAAVAAAAVAIVAVSGGDDASGPCPGADGRSRELRRCLAESLAYIETQISAGSGVLLEGGYVVTNAHVVDPYGEANVSFGSGRTFEAVPVVGVDAFADIAVLGPIETDRRPLALEPIPDFDEVEEPDVFLVGYPGGIESSDPEIALSGGLLSRLREDDTFGLTYLQTDAAIAGGQSGGALVDENGTLLGISGLRFAEEFALALSADDVAASPARIQAGDGDERRVLPTLDDAASDPISTELTVDHPSRIMVLPAGSERREVVVTATSPDDVAIHVSTAWGEAIGVNDAGMDWAQQQAEDFADPTLDDIDLLDEERPGMFRFDAPSGEDVIVLVGRVDDDTTVELSADVPFAVFDDTRDGEPVTIDEPLRGVIDGVTYEVIHPVELEAGDVIEISVHAGTSDAYFTLLEPGEEYDPSAEPDVDDGGGGLYDLDAAETFDVERSGTYRIVVSTWDGVVTGYELTVRRTG